MFQSDELLLNLSIDTGRDCEDDHEQPGQRTNHDGDKSDHEQRTQNIDDHIHQMPPETPVRPRTGRIREV